MWNLLFVVMGGFKVSSTRYDATPLIPLVVGSFFGVDGELVLYFLIGIFQILLYWVC